MVGDGLRKLETTFRKRAFLLVTYVCIQICRTLSDQDSRNPPRTSSSPFYLWAQTTDRWSFGTSGFAHPVVYPLINVTVSILCYVTICYPFIEALDLANGSCRLM